MTGYLGQGRAAADGPRDRDLADRRSPEQDHMDALLDETGACCTDVETSA